MTPVRRESYWSLLCNEIDATREVPETRWNTARFHDPNPAKAGKMVTRRGGYLGEIDQFDAQFFGVSPREANLLDPQQRLLLQVTWEALEDGGIPADALAGTDVGVFIGGFTLDHQLLQNQGRTSRFRFKTHSTTGMMMTMLSNRISFAFDLRGPSMTIDTACSSSLVAVHLAAQSIWDGECDLALAGGVNVIIGPNTAIAESKSGFLAPTGGARPSTTPPTVTPAERAAPSSSSNLWRRRCATATRSTPRSSAQSLSISTSLMSPIDLSSGP